MFVKSFNTSEDLVGDLADLSFTKGTVDFDELVEGERLWGSYFCHEVNVLMLLVIHFQTSAEIRVRNKNLVHTLNRFTTLNRVINTSKVPNLVQSTLHLQMWHLNRCNRIHT